MYIEPVYKDSYMNLCLATNHKEAMVMADPKMRRFLHLEAKLDPLLNHPGIKDLIKKNDPNSLAHDYFAILKSVMEDNDNLGLKTFANLLYNLPLQHYDPKNVPMTHLLFINKLNGIEEIKTWWLECLQRGYVYPEFKLIYGGFQEESHIWKSGFKGNKNYYQFYY